MEVPRLGVQSELQLPAYTTARATPDPSCTCDLHHSSQQRRILNPLSEARNQTRNLLAPSHIQFHWLQELQMSFSHLPVSLLTIYSKTLEQKLNSLSWHSNSTLWSAFPNLIFHHTLLTLMLQPHGAPLCSCQAGTHSNGGLSTGCSSPGMPSPGFSDSLFLPPKYRFRHHLFRDLPSHSLSRVLIWFLTQHYVICLFANALPILPYGDLSRDHTTITAVLPTPKTVPGTK